MLNKTIAGSVLDGENIVVSSIPSRSLMVTALSSVLSTELEILRFVGSDLLIEDLFEISTNSSGVSHTFEPTNALQMTEVLYIECMESTNDSVFEVIREIMETRSYKTAELPNLKSVVLFFDSSTINSDSRVNILLNQKNVLGLISHKNKF